MATLTVRNLDDDLVRALRPCSAARKRSAEAEHREILRRALTRGDRDPTRTAAAERLAEFRRRPAGRGSASTADLLRESREDRIRTLTGSSDA